LYFYQCYLTDDTYGQDLICLLFLEFLVYPVPIYHLFFQCGIIVFVFAVLYCA